MILKWKSVLLINAYLTLFINPVSIPNTILNYILKLIIIKLLTHLRRKEFLIDPNSHIQSHFKLFISNSISKNAYLTIVHKTVTFHSKSYVSLLSLR